MTAMVMVWQMLRTQKTPSRNGLSSGLGDVWLWLCYRSGREVSLFPLLKGDGQTLGLQLDTATSRSWYGARTEPAFRCCLD